MSTILTKLLLALFLMVGLPGYAEPDSPGSADMLAWQQELNTKLVAPFQVSIINLLDRGYMFDLFRGAKRGVTLTISVASSGQLRALVLEQSSGFEEVDTTVIQKTRGIFPVTPFPKTFKRPYISFQFYVTSAVRSLRNSPPQIPENFNQVMLEECSRSPKQFVDLIKQYENQLVDDYIDLLVHASIDAGEWEGLDQKIKDYRGKFPTSQRLFLSQAKLSYAQADYVQGLIDLSNYSPPQTEDELVLYGGIFYKLQGDILFELGRNQQALTAWTKAIKYPPSSYQGELELITAYVRGDNLTPEMKQKYVQAKTAQITACPSIGLYKDIRGPKLKEVVKQLDASTGYAP